MPRPRLAAAVRADARRLPVPDASADVATGMYFHTDTEDFAAVVREFVAPDGGILPWDLALLAEKPRQIPRASR